MNLLVFPYCGYDGHVEDDCWEKKLDGKVCSFCANKDLVEEK